MIKTLLSGHDPPVFITKSLMITVVIGAGIVGLHVARVSRERGHDVYVLDEAPFLAEHTSGRNSGVIHSGIFYETGSLKEKVCIEGNSKTYEWVKKLNVPHNTCGKWVVPEVGQEDQLDAFYEKIRQLPIPSPQKIPATTLANQEPQLRQSEALFIPSTGIVDAATYVKKMSLYLESQGVNIILNCKVNNVKENTLLTSRGDIHFDVAINAAGLFCDDIASLSGLTGYRIKPCRGDYYLLAGQPISKPVYHLPYKEAHGLGVHLTPTGDGNTLLGPNAFFIDEKKDYQHYSSSDAFEKAVRFYLPRLKDVRLQPAYCGNRPKLFFQNKPIGEFVIKKEKNWVHLLGIESPGLTSAPVLAQMVLDQI